MYFWVFGQVAVFPIGLLSNVCNQGIIDTTHTYFHLTIRMEVC